MPVFTEIDTLLSKHGLLRHSVATEKVAAAVLDETAAPPAAGAGPKLWVVAKDDVWYLEQDEAKAQAAAQQGYHVEPLVPGLVPGMTEAQARVAATASRTPVLQNVARERDIKTAKDVNGVGGQGLRTIWVVDGKPEVALWPGAHMDNAPGGRRTNRVLVLVHGTFSSTQSLITDFGTDGDGVALLQEFTETYRTVVGFTHFTRSVYPDENARLLTQQMQELLKNLKSNPAWGGADPEIDFMGHSRGGLVIRSLLEMLSPADVPFLNRVRNVIFVATPNAGTNLALPANWGRLVGAFAKILIAVPGAGLVFDELMTRLGSGAEDQWPGVDCMEPGGAWLAKNLYRCCKPAGIKYYSVSGDYRPAEWGLLKAAEDKFWDLLFRVANDTVVDTQSVTGQTVVPVKGQHELVGTLLPLAAALLIADRENDPDVGNLAQLLKDANISVQTETKAGVNHSGYFRTEPFRKYVSGILIHS